MTNKLSVIFRSVPLLVLLDNTSLCCCHAWVTADFCRQVRAYTPLDTACYHHHVAIAEEGGFVQVPMPVIQWTVPRMKRGWQDEGGNWWDEDGLRQGPPMNYWRQRSDERSFEHDMKILQRVLMDDIIVDNEDTVLSNLSCQIQKPMLNRKFLGVWAPIVRNGHKVVGPSSDDNYEEARLLVPYTITIARPGLRQLGPTTGYGTFDAHLQPGEAIAVSIGDETFPLTAQADANQVQELGHHVLNNKGLEDPLEIGTGGVYVSEPLKIGNIVYLSDYLLVMTDNNGKMQECWTRAMPSLPVPKEEAAKIRQAFERASQTAESLATLI